MRYGGIAGGGTTGRTLTSLSYQTEAEKMTGDSSRVLELSVDRGLDGGW